MKAQVSLQTNGGTSLLLCRVAEKLIALQRPGLCMGRIFKKQARGAFSVEVTAWTGCSSRNSWRNQLLLNENPYPAMFSVHPPSLLPSQFWGRRRVWLILLPPCLPTPSLPRICLCLPSIFFTVTFSSSLLTPFQLHVTIHKSLPYQKEMLPQTHLLPSLSSLHSLRPMHCVPFPPLLLSHRDLHLIPIMPLHICTKTPKGFLAVKCNGQFHLLMEQVLDLAAPFGTGHASPGGFFPGFSDSSWCHLEGPLSLLPPPWSP